MIPETSRATRPLPGWVVALGPLVLLAALVTLIVRTAPADRLRPQGAPPVERLAIERALLQQRRHRPLGAERRAGSGHHRASDGGRCVLGVHCGRRWYDAPASGSHVDFDPLPVGAR